MAIAKAFSQIKNVQRPQLPKDFRFSALAAALYVVLIAGGVVWQSLAGPFGTTEVLIQYAVGALVSLLVLIAVPLWGVAMALAILFCVGVLGGAGMSYYPLAVGTTAALLLAPAFQIAHHWEKAIILRLGRFHGLRGPGVFIALPIVDRVVRYVDTRIRATDFSAENTITMDTVPVYVDALAFWMVWDPQKAVLEVENFLEAVVLSAQTALRDAIGKHELSELLEERDRLGREIQQILDAKTSAWGITILSTEIRDIIIPKELENAMSRRAQAERERQSRVILGTAEIEISEKFVKAADNYRDDPTALHLRAMNMIYEGIKQNGTIVLLPSTALSGMSLGSVLDDLAKGRKIDPNLILGQAGSSKGENAGGRQAGDSAGEAVRPSSGPQAERTEDSSTERFDDSPAADGARGGAGSHAAGGGSMDRVARRTDAEKRRS